MLLTNISEGSRLQNFLHTPAAERAKQEGAAGKSDAVATLSVQSSLTSNLSQLSGVLGNLSDDGSGESKYLRATKNSLQASRSTAMRQNAVLTAAVAEVNALGPDASLADRILVGKKAARAMRQEMAQSTREHSEQNLEEIKKDIEEKAREAAAPEDADGKPVAESEAASSTAESAAGEAAENAEPAEQQTVSEQNPDADAADAPLRADVAAALAAYVSAAADAPEEQAASQNALDAMA